jgi:hypothetical protein
VKEKVTRLYAMAGTGLGGRASRVIAVYPSAIDGGGWLTPRPDRFIPREDSRYLLQKAGWPSGPVWAGMEKRKSVAGPGFRPRTVQPVASHYTGSIFWREFVLRMKSERFSETPTAIYGLHIVAIVRTAVLNCGGLLRAGLL